MGHQKRILSSKKHLMHYLLDNEKFYVGLLFEDFVKKPNLEKFKLPKGFADGLRTEPAAGGAVTKANLNGRYVRKQPEEKQMRTVHIRYFRKDGTLVEFDRDFYAYVKVMQHKYNAALNFATNKHGQRVIVSDELTFDDENEMKNTHIINLFCEMFGEFEIFNRELEPAIHFNKRFAEDLLPHGVLDDEKIEELNQFTGRYTRNPEAQGIFQKKLHILKEFNPDVRGKGPNGFFGYIVFGFSDLGIVILENMYPNNATYIFKMDGYESKVISDKQKALKDDALIKRMYHHDNWEQSIRDFIENLRKKSK